jgi:hypothetical protein
MAISFPGGTKCARVANPVVSTNDFHCFKESDDDFEKTITRKSLICENKGRRLNIRWQNQIHLWTCTESRRELLSFPAPPFRKNLTTAHRYWAFHWQPWAIPSPPSSAHAWPYAILSFSLATVSDSESTLLGSCVAVCHFELFTGNRERFRGLWIDGSD